MAKLHISKFGKGPDLILLHGWGSSSKVWRLCLEKLSLNFCVWCIDLPGHGESHAVKWDYSVAQGVEMLAQSLPKTCSVIGWSLGGLYAQLYATQYPQRVKKLMLIASIPKFIADSGWPHGMPKDEFENFSRQFVKSPRKTLQKFYSLQVLNTNLSKKTHSILLNALSNQQKHLNNIQWGLHWLRDIDLRTEAALTDRPIHILHGDKDAICSFFAAQDMVKQWGNTHLEKISNAGHAPFISHLNQFLKQVEAWC